MSENQGADDNTIDQQFIQKVQAIDVPGMGDQPAITEQMEQTRAKLSETIDAGREQLSPEHVMEQAQEQARRTARNPVDQVRETMRAAASGNVEQVVSSARDTAKTVAGSAGDVAKPLAGIAADVAKPLAGIAADVAKTLLLPAGAILLAGGLVLGLLAGLFLGLLRNNTARSGATARGQLPPPPEPRDVARRPRQIVWKRR